MKTVWMGLVAWGALGLAAQAQARTCAYLYDDETFRGEVLEVQSGPKVPDIGSQWNDRVSSWKVERGCTLTVWHDTNFGGSSTTLREGHYPFMRERWNNSISSYHCMCSDAPGARGWPSSKKVAKFPSGP
ncbi:peptidase inhibitor family I36 protein [Polyangium jinanense]|uniref:Peptidase inhibitor family I36 protein n=2 Tax=Polyangium jinanense TaxID=2829994 RepID=A0A9X4AXL9_9BACT|nr:peptidase inhibitor family I36 protein [Polyangium jinanense]